MIDAYARFADSREPNKQYALYTDDGKTLVYIGDTNSEPEILTTRDEHLAGFATLSRYTVTTHFNGQSQIDLDEDSATAECYCLAHHILDSPEGRTLTIMSIRYEDTFARTAPGWRFSERRLIITWTDTRPSTP